MEVGRRFLSRRIHSAGAGSEKDQADRVAASRHELPFSSSFNEVRSNFALSPVNAACSGTCEIDRICLANVGRLR